MTSERLGSTVIMQEEIPLLLFGNHKRLRVEVRSFFTTKQRDFAFLLGDGNNFLLQPSQLFEIVKQKRGQESGRSADLQAIETRFCVNPKA